MRSFADLLVPLGIEGCRMYAGRATEQDLPTRCCPSECRGGRQSNLAES